MKSLIQKMVEVLKETEGIEQTAETLIQQAYDKGFKDGKKHFYEKSKVKLVGQHQPLIVTGRLQIEKEQETRDRIVKSAISDIENLKHCDDLYEVIVKSLFPVYCKAEFVINKEKRTVVAILRGVNTNSIRSRGIAKCSPSDTFNANIGMVIALYRALNKPLRRIYLDVPNPTEVRVGNRVLNEDGFIRKVVYRASEVVDYRDSKRTGKEMTCQIKSPNASLYVTQILDDSESVPNDH